MKEILDSDQESPLERKELILRRARLQIIFVRLKTARQYITRNCHDIREAKTRSPTTRTTVKIDEARTAFLARFPPTTVVSQRRSQLRIDSRRMRHRFSQKVIVLPSFSRFCPFFVFPAMARVGRKRGEIGGYRSEMMHHSRSGCARLCRTCDAYNNDSRTIISFQNFIH